MTRLVIIPALAGLAYSVKSALQFWKAYQAVQEHPLYDIHPDPQNIAKQTILNISFVGGCESGKSQLIAHLGYQFGSYASPHLNIRLLSHKEEEKLRGRHLKELSDYDGDSHLNLDEYSSESLIRVRQALFKKGRYQKDIHPEQIYLKSTFDALKPHCLNLHNIPGDFLLDERGHQGHFNQVLNKSEALVLVLDGPELVNAFEQKQAYPSILHYTQILERYYQYSPVGPVYLIISKSDLIKQINSEHIKLWEDYILSTVLPLLQLEAHQSTLKIYWTSVDEHAESRWSELNHFGLSLFNQVKERLIERQAQWQQVQAEYQTSRKKLSFTLLLSGFLLWWLMGVFQMSTLPTIRGDVTWDWGSLNTSSQPYIKAYHSAQSIFHPLSLYKDDLHKDLKLLNSAYYKHLNDQSRVLIKSLVDERNLSQAEQQLNQALEEYLSFQKQVAVWLKRKEAEVNYINDIKNLIQNLNTRQKLKASQSIVAPQELFKSLELNKWRKRCEYSQGEDKFTCLIHDSYLSIYKQALEVSLQQVSQINTKVMIKNPQKLLFLHLSPLLRWQNDSQALNPQVLSPRDPIVLNYQRLLKQTWHKAWQNLLGQLSQSKLNAGIKRLRLIQNFELNRRELESQYMLNLAMPKEIMSHWVELLNREVDQQKQSLQAQEMIRWAENYLDHHRAARVRLSQAELSWQNKITHALGRTHQDPTQLQAAIEQMHLDLVTLQSLNGANDIKGSLELWKNRLVELQTWLKPQKLNLILESISCNDDRFEALGYKINEGHWSYYTLYYPDQMNYYLRVQTLQEKAWLDIAQLGQGESVEVTWSPWQKLKLSIYDQDGSKDPRVISTTQQSPAGPPIPTNKSEQVEQVEQVEQDDDLVGLAKEWHEQRDPPNGTIQFAPEDLCSVKLQSSHALPKWLFELHWLEEQNTP